MTNIYPSLDDVKKLLSQSDKKFIIPFWHEILADLETPVSAYHKVCRNKEYGYLLESAESGENFGRYSYIGAEPLFILKSDLKESNIFNAHTNEVILSDKNPYTLLSKILENYETGDFGLDYTPDAVGYFGYDSIRFIEPKLKESFEKIEICESFPDAYFMIAGLVLIFDHLNHKIYIVNNVPVDKNTNLDEIFKNSKNKIDNVLDLLSRSHNLKPLTLSKNEFQGEIASNFTKDTWIKAVKTAKEHIIAGDIFQVVLSQRFCVQKPEIDNFDLYRALRSVNPSPYLYYLNFGEFNIIGSSPEVMVKCSKDKTASIRPIAGTKPRGASKEEDLKLEETLLEDPKERSEHIMLVDLARNDLGRVCEYGTVKVDDLMHVEKYSHVMHIVSNVSGKLREHLNSVDLTKACFPAGTLSGAPKIKAMEIIYDLEKSARGPYGGCVGVYNFDGEANTAITIRTMLIKDDKIFIQAGAGIVADSDPDLEYQETQNKAAALVQTMTAFLS
ncbi:MAG: anthranilate synthase component I [Candidatus Gastranaerophilaceae bacterium]|jgi:anthranilate synthase component 1